MYGVESIRVVDWLTNMTSTEKKKYFYPTKAEFRSFECYLQSLEKRSDRTGGIIIRPPDYYLDDIHLAHDEEQWASCPMKITVQSVEKADDSGVYLLSSYVKRGPRRKYAAMKEALVATTPAGEKSNYNDDDYHEIEAAYWNSPLIQQGGQVEYGSDNEGLIVPPTFEEGNLRQFRFLMRSLKSPRGKLFRLSSIKI